MAGIQTDDAEKKTAAASPDNDERYRLLVELSSDLIGILIDQNIAFINAAGAKMLGASQSSQLYGLPICQFIHAKNRASAVKRIQQVIESGAPSPLVEEEWLRLDGAVERVEVAVIPFPNPGGSSVQVVARNISHRSQGEEAPQKNDSELEKQVEQRTQDLTKANRGLELEIDERKRMEQTISEYAKRLEALHEIDRGILTAQSPQAIAEAAMRHIGRLVTCQRLCVVEFDTEAGQALFLSVRADLPTRLGAGQGLPINAFRVDILSKGGIHSVPDISTLSSYTELDQTLREEGIRCYLNVPLTFQRQLIGCLLLGTVQAGFFTEAHHSLAAEIAFPLAVAMRNARLREQTNRDTETKAMLLHEVNHRVKNNLAAIIGLLFSIKRNTPVERDGNQLNVIDDLIGRIQGLAVTHRLLSATQWSPVSLGDLTTQVIQACLHALSPHRRVTVEVSPCKVQVTAKLANSLALVISELTTNTIKYAIRDRPSAKISVVISVSNNMVLYEYRDDGPGYPDETLELKAHNVGLYLIQAIVRNDMQGAITLHNDGGAVTRIRFNAEERKQALYDSTKWGSGVGG